MTRRLRWLSLAVVVQASLAWAQGTSAPAATPPAATTVPAAEAPATAPPPAPSLPPPPPVTEPAAAPVAVPAPAIAPPVTGRGAVPPAEVVSDRSFGIHVAVNLGLFAVDLQQGHFYGFAAGNAGVPLVSNGSIGAFAIGLGYTTPLSRPDESMWFMDFFFDALPGWTNMFSGGGSVDAVVGVGVGLGFRFLHRSGFTAGFKIPVFGASFSTASSFSTSASVGMYYLFSAIALPIISFGYRF